MRHNFEMQCAPPSACFVVTVEDVLCYIKNVSGETLQANVSNPASHPLLAQNAVWEHQGNRTPLDTLCMYLE